jgi:hypothetical protein
MVILLAEYKIKDFKNNQIKMTRTIVVILALISLGNISCKKDTQALPQNKNVTKKETSSMYSALFGGSLFYDGLIQYRADCESRRDTAGNIHQSVYYLGTGNFYDNLVTQGLNVGNVSWGGIILTPDSARYGRWTYQFDNSHYSNPINSLEVILTSQLQEVQLTLTQLLVCMCLMKFIWIQNPGLVHHQLFIIVNFLKQYIGIVTLIIKMGWL